MWAHDLELAFTGSVRGTHEFWPGRSEEDATRAARETLEGDRYRRNKRGLQNRKGI